MFDLPHQAMIKHYVGMNVEGVKMNELDRLGMNFTVTYKGQVSETGTHFHILLKHLVNYLSIFSNFTFHRGSS